MVFKISSDYQKDINSIYNKIIFAVLCLQNYWQN